MKVLVIAVGRVKRPVAAAVTEYEERAHRYWKMDVIEVAGGASGRDASADRVRAAEADRILARVPAGFEVVALTREGDRSDSRELARLMEEHALRATRGIAFLIGGAFGLGEPVLARAQRTLSLSAMTLPHEMARLVLAEQLYRAGTIVRGEPYHKG